MSKVDGMTPEEAIERTLAALADLPSGPPAEEVLAVIQAAAWDEGFDEGRSGDADTELTTQPTNPYRSQA